MTSVNAVMDVKIAVNDVKTVSIDVKKAVCY